MTVIPLLAVTGVPSTDRICQANSCRPAMRLATRSGSTADTNAIMEKSGNSKKLMHSGPAAGRSDGVAGKLMADSVAYTSYWNKLMRKQAATLACQQQPSRPPQD